jgi:hypothetical protein
MIILSNTSQNPFSVQYVNGSQVFKKEILPNSLAAFKNLATASQIVNQQSLTGNNIGIYDYTNVTFVNQGSFLTGYKGRTQQTGMTITTPLLTTPTGYTFVTSAATTGVALNSATATTVGNSIRVAYSGAAVTTLTWLNAINATTFSGLGFTVLGANAYSLISSGATQTFTVSSDTISSNVTNAYFIGNDVKREEYGTYDAFDLNAVYATLSGLTA